MAKRNEAQLDFDYAKHGWAFCNKAMLGGKVTRLTELAKALQPNDKRHGELEAIRRKWEEM